MEDKEEDDDDMNAADVKATAAASDPPVPFPAGADNIAALDFVLLSFVTCTVSSAVNL